jgi:hypothetical protein
LVALQESYTLLSFSPTGLFSTTLSVYLPFW